MSLFDNECGCGKKKRASKCDGCVCDQLRNLQPGTEVDVFLPGSDGASSGPVNNLTFACLDEKNCCATFLDSDYPIIIDCRKIVAIRVRRG